MVSLRDIERQYKQGSFTIAEESKYIYDPTKFIPIAYDVVNDAPYFVDVRKTRHILIVGTQGTGKSIQVGRIADLYYLGGAHIDVLLDKHSEFSLVHKPNHLYNKMLRFERRLAGNVEPEIFMPFYEEPFGWTNFQRYSPEFCWGSWHKTFLF